MHCCAPLRRRCRQRSSGSCAAGRASAAAPGSCRQAELRGPHHRQHRLRRRSESTVAQTPPSLQPPLRRARLPGTAARPMAALTPPSLQPPLRRARPPGTAPQPAAALTQPQLQLPLHGPHLRLPKAAVQPTAAAAAAAAKPMPLQDRRQGEAAEVGAAASAPARQRSPLAPGWPAHGGPRRQPTMTRHRRQRSGGGSGATQRQVRLVQNFSASHKPTTSFCRRHGS